MIVTMSTEAQNAAQPDFRKAFLATLIIGAIGAIISLPTLLQIVFLLMQSDSWLYTLNECFHFSSTTTTMVPLATLAVPLCSWVLIVCAFLIRRGRRPAIAAALTIAAIQLALIILQAVILWRGLGPLANLYLLLVIPNMFTVILLLHLLWSVVLLYLIQTLARCLLPPRQPRGFEAILPR